MKILLDTNIIIHRETHKVIRDDIGILFYWIDKLHYDKYIHPNTIKEIEKYKDPKIVEAFRIKLGSYNTIQAVPELDETVKTISQDIDVNENDFSDTEILNIQFLGITDLFITEDKKIRQKASLLNIQSTVLSIEEFLERVSIENPEFVEYKVLSVQKKRFGEVNLSDPFFDSFREDYVGFNQWFRKKNDEFVYVCLAENKVLAFLYLKNEGLNESYSDISPPFTKCKRMKIGTFKVVLNGFKLGERFIKVIFDNAIIQNVEEIYVTIFNKSIEQQRLINLLEVFGFINHGYKTSSSGQEIVFIRKLQKNTYNPEMPKITFPYINRNSRAFLVPIYEKYHTDLFPDSILKTESPVNYIENEPYRNAISKVYISRSHYKELVSGDNIVFYRSGGFYKSVITTIGVVEQVITEIKSFEEFKKYCGKRSVFSDAGLKEFWDRYPDLKPFIVYFLYVYSFPHRINMENLIRLGIIKDVRSAPRGFEQISQAQFDIIIKETRTDARFIID